MMRALANNTVLKREYWQCSLKLEIISTKELNMNLWLKVKDVNLRQMSAFCCVHNAMVVPECWANPWVVFHSEVHPLTGAVNMSIERWDLSTVLFCCTEIKQKTHETLQNITVWQKSGSPVTAQLQNHSSTSALTVWPHVFILLMVSRSKTTVQGNSPFIALI